MRTFLTLIFALLTFFDIIAQNNKTDSIEVVKTTVDFFDWYINSIKKGQLEEYSPIFIKNKHGMTTLNDSIYINNLLKHSFSNSLIYIERQSYNNCKNNLDKIKFSTFESEIKDLDQFEKLECDFNNYYRWLGGQEIVDGFSISKIEFNNNTAKVTGQTFFYKNLKENSIKGRIIVTLIRHLKGWKIHSIEN